jgi:membrane protease YdiL (CAAX protease family)
VSNATRRSTREILLLILCFFAVWTVRATYLYAIDDAIASDALRTVYSLAVKLLLWGVPAFGYARWVRRQSPLRYLGLAILPSARQWLKYLIVIALFLGAQVGFETLVGGRQLSLSGVQAALTVPGLLALAASAFLEELLFRGLLLHELAALLPRWGAVLLTALLFAGIHLPFWLSHGGLSATMLTNAGGVFLFSLLAGWLYLDSTSIWPPTLAHIANNCLAIVLIG